MIRFTSKKKIGRVTSQSEVKNKMAVMIFTRRAAIFLLQVANFNTTLSRTACVPPSAMAHLIPHKFFLGNRFAPPPHPTRQYNNRVDVRRRKYVFGPTQAHFIPSRRRGLKWVPRRAKNIFTPVNINSITIIIISEGIPAEKESKTVQ